MLKMFQQLILLALFAHNSLTFKLPNNVDDHRRWPRRAPRRRPSVATTAKPNTENRNEHGHGCRFEKGNFVEPIKFYAKPGEDEALVHLPEPNIEDCLGFVRRDVHPKRARFGLGEHVMTYSVWYKVDDQRERKIEKNVSFSVVACNCRPNRTVNAEVETNEMEAAVNWRLPIPTCPWDENHANHANNPPPYARLSVGKHVITYKYRAPPGFPKLEMECHVNIIVRGKFCGETTYNPATHTCCWGSIYEKNSDYECCGENYYNPNEQLCCANSRLRPIEENCSSTA